LRTFGKAIAAGREGTRAKGIKKFTDRTIRLTAVIKKGAYLLIYRNR